MPVFRLLLGLLAAVMLALLAYHVTAELVGYASGSWYWLPREGAPISGIH